MPRYFTTSLEISPGFLLTALPLPCSVSIEQISPEGLAGEAKDSLPEFIHGTLPVPPRFLNLKPGDTLYVLEAVGPPDNLKKTDCKFYRISISE